MSFSFMPFVVKDKSCVSDEAVPTNSFVQEKTFLFLVTFQSEGIIPIKDIPLSFISIIGQTLP